MSDNRRFQPFTLPDDILPRLRAREEAAYHELVKHAFGPMVRFAYGFVRSYDIANDVAQDVLVRILEMGGKFDPKGPLVPYLYAAVRNRSLNTMRGANRETSRASKAIVHMDMATVTNPEEFDSGGIDDFLHHLTELQSTAIRLRYVEQRTVPEIAAALAISVTSAERLVRRALEKLRKEAEG